MITPNAISQKCKYALQAVFELALRDSAEPVKIQDIAAAQAIPARFLEVILAELKHGGFVESRRGNDGGYILARPASEITVGQVIDFLQGKAGDKGRGGHKKAALMGDYVFSKLWKEVDEAVSGIYNSVTFAELVKRELAQRKYYVPNWAI